MNTEDVLLVARVNADALFESLEWVTATDAPYQAIDPIDFDDEILDAVFDMYVATYSAIDSRFNIPDKYGLFEYNRWILVDDNDGNLLGFVLLKTTAAGLKMGVTASDRSAVGKKAVRTFSERVFFIDGVFSEVSDAVERIVLKAYVPKVRAD